MSTETDTGFRLMLKALDTDIAGLLALPVLYDGPDWLPHLAEIKRRIHLRLTADHLRAAWQISSFTNGLGPVSPTRGPRAPVRAKYPYIRRGQADLMTTTTAYELPLLQALVDLGGQSYYPNVIERVGVLMQDTLTPYDHQPSKSWQEHQRWQHHAYWAHSQLKARGLLTDGNGIWTLTLPGRVYLDARTTRGASRRERNAS